MVLDEYVVVLDWWVDVAVVVDAVEIECVEEVAAVLDDVDVELDR